VDAARYPSGVQRTASHSRGGVRHAGGCAVLGQGSRRRRKSRKRTWLYTLYAAAQEGHVAAVQCIVKELGGSSPSQSRGWHILAPASRAMPRKRMRCKREQGHA
jgi:hypothetical protein